MENNEGFRAIVQQTKAQLTILGTFVALFWLVEIVDGLLFRGGLDFFGVRPRTVSGLWGILFGPFLHANIGHVLANTLPFLILGWFVMLQGIGTFFLVTLSTAVISGLGIWLIGPSGSVHIGASGLVFGYFGYLLLRGYFERSFASLAWSGFVILLYGGMIWGVFPQTRGVSWQAHLFGFIGGGLVAYRLAGRKAAPERPEHDLV